MYKQMNTLNMTISHYRLWGDFFHDKIYRNSDLVMDICTELANDMDYSVDVYYKDEPITSLGDGKICHEVDILYCYEYPEVYKESEALQGIDDGPEIESLPIEPDNFPGLWQEVFISLLIEYGLPYTDKKKQLNYSLDPLTDKILSVSSTKVFNLADIENALNQLELPFPSRLFPEKITNTQDLYNKIQKTNKHGLNFEYSLSNIRKMMEIIELIHEQQQYTARMVIEKHVVYFYFDGHEGWCPKRAGHLYLKHIFENPHKDLPLKGIETGFVAGETKDYDDNTDGKADERGVDAADKKMKKSLEAEIKETQDELDELEKIKLKRDSDLERIEVLKSELSDLLKDHDKRFDKYDNPRKETSASLKQIYDRVSNNIENCLKDFPKDLKPLKDHIKGGSIEKNINNFKYSPPDWVRWHVVDKRGK